MTINIKLYTTFVYVVASALKQNAEATYLVKYKTLFTVCGTYHNSRFKCWLVESNINLLLLSCHEIIHCVVHF